MTSDSEEISFEERFNNAEAQAILWTMHTSP